MKKDDDKVRKLELIETGDGSYTFLHTGLNETYHSRHGALTESEYVYIQEGLNKLEHDNLMVVETGFGTGLNALLACISADQSNKHISYFTFEPYPIPFSELPLPRFLEGQTKWIGYWEDLHACDWNSIHEIHPGFHFCKYMSPIQDAEFSENADIIFHDAFAPKYQPEMWSAEMFMKLRTVLKPGGILVTYSAAGIVKSALKSAGFQITRLPGPPGKKHMVRAVKPQ